jgi:uncharacterized protein YndB with AHSA1/START domain
MVRPSVFAAVLATALGCWQPPAPPPAVQQPAVAPRTETVTDYLAALSWMGGIWSSKKNGEQVSEEWVQVHPWLMLGSNRTLIDGELSSYEHLEIWARDDDLVYRAKPAGQPAVEFALVELAEHKAAFENPAHDFPRRIVYAREGDGLEVSIEGQIDGAPTTRSWSWKRQHEQGPRDYILRSVAVEAPADEVFRAFVDAEQATTFFAPAARIEPWVGGAYEMYFMLGEPEGNRGGEGCTVVQISPPGLIAFTWNFPPEIPTLRHAHTLVTIQVSPLDEGRARVDLKQTGFRTGQDWDEGRAYFERAWGIVLDRLQQRFESGPYDWSK